MQQDKRRYAYRLEGLDCAGCAAKIEAKAAELDGVAEAAMNFTEKKLVLTAAEGDYTAAVQAVCASVEGGIRVCAADERVNDRPEPVHGDKAAWGRIAAAAVLFALGWLPGLPQWAQVGLYALAAVLACVEVAKDAWREWKTPLLGENSLLLIAVVAAFAIGEYGEGVLVTLLFAVGEQLEAYAVGKSRRQIEALAAIRPDRAWKLQPDGSAIEVDAETIEAEDILFLPPHQRVPVDCVVLDGASEVDTAALTGESMPVYVSAGAALLSGTMNGDAALKVRATARASASAAARILEMVSDSAARKGRSERFITRFARVYTPVVIGLAVLLAVVPPLLGAGSWTEWLSRGLVFLVASCPCALVISVPLGFYAGIGAASRRGVLIKGGRFVETLAHARAVAFDKTGTLTTGELAVTGVTCAGGMTEKEALALAAGLEIHSAHPIASAIVAYAAANGAEPVPADQVTERPALGTAAVVNGQTVLCGGRRLMDSEGVEVAELGDAPVYLAVDGIAEAAFTIQTVLRAEAAQAMRELRALGVERLTMLTGDRQSEAARVAREAGISEFSAELLPDGKREALRRLRQEAGVTLFVGDGINDAPVLAEADAGVAMGLGSAAALEAGDVVLMAGNLRSLPEAVRLSRRVMGVVRFNIVFALAVKTAVLVLAAVGYAPMWAAVFADVGVSILSVLNSVRLLRTKNAGN